MAVWPRRLASARKGKDEAVDGKLAEEEEPATEENDFCSPRRYRVVTHLGSPKYVNLKSVADVVSLTMGVHCFRCYCCDLPDNSSPFKVASWSH